jgi:protein-tyrosine phosphatase
MTTPHKEIEHPVFEYNYIDENVIIGTNACCKMHFDEDLLKDGVTCDISLEGEHVDQPNGVECYLWLPTIDHTPPTKDQVMTGIQSLEEMLRQKKKVYIHCKNGHGRAPTFYASFLILKRGLSVEAAIEAIRSKRPTMHLEESQINFLKLLK